MRPQLPPLDLGDDHRALHALLLVAGVVVVLLVLLVLGSTPAR
jgi:hypothetical protein